VKKVMKATLTIGIKNAITNLGSIEIPITGL
jgi:hypothetical protein